MRRCQSKGLLQAHQIGKDQNGESSYGGDFQNSHIYQVHTISQAIPFLQTTFLTHKLSDTSLNLKAYLNTCVEKAVEASSERIDTDERSVPFR